MNTYSVDLSLRPTTFDFWHVCLAAAVLVLMGLLILLLIGMLLGKNRQPVETAPVIVQQPTIAPPPPAPAEPVVKIIEKIVEVEKLVPAPAPEPVILKEYTPDAALQLISILQKEARFIDFIKEDITAYSDADIGAATRVVHQGCAKALNDHFSLAPIRDEKEGSSITVLEDFDAASLRLTGNIVGHAPFTGALIHKGWQATEVRLPKLSQSHNPKIIAAAEIEL
ncbi:MAG: DUF2760 domain-containing protein [Gammaproteobacteria bacterium]|nr:DUF2760 domain-containing protein [Gammaproteobacteria bacterium]